MLNGQDGLKEGFNQFFYGNGQVSSEGWIQDGKPNGKWTTYWVNGNIKSEGLRRNFQLDSIWSFYDENGRLTEQINYRYGQKNGYYLKFRPVAEKDSFKLVLVSKELYLGNQKQGISYYYDNEGDIKQIIRYKDSKKQGLMRELGPDGVIQVVYTYHNGFMIDREFINQKDREGKKQGVWRDYYDNDNIRFEANYKDDLLNGYYREYGESGKLLSSKFYENGQEVEKDPESEISVEVRTRYDDNGKLVSSGGFLNNIPVGTHRDFSKGENVVEVKEYNNSGQIISTGQTDNQGLRDEYWQFFYPGGQVRSEGLFKDDRRSGEWKFYYPNGILEQTGHYINGREDGAWTWYYENGKVLREENYYRGREDGLSVEYGEDGQEVSKGEYLEGLEEGEWYYRVGDQTEKGSYKAGLRDGIWYYYYPDGALKFEGAYVQGNANGRHRYYYKNGKVKEEQYYVMGQKNRTWYSFDEEGNVTIFYTYQNDILTKINGVRVTLEDNER